MSRQLLTLTHLTFISLSKRERAF